MSCNCTCNCGGSWQTPALSLPIDRMMFEGANAMHCAQSPMPRHRLACNLPGLSRARRSTDFDCVTDDNGMMVLLATAGFLIMLGIILTLINYNLKNRQTTKDCKKDAEHL